jgi:HlyD family secretion protein
MRKIAIGAIVVLALVGGAFFLWNRSKADGAMSEVSVRRALVERGEMVVSVPATGSVVPVDAVRLSFDLPGKVAAVWVETGDAVKTGDELASLDDSALTFQVRQANAALAAAQAQLDRLQAGPREGEVAAAEASLKAAEARLDGAQANLRELETGPDEEQVAAAEANLGAADASLRLSTVQRDQVAKGASAAEIAAGEAESASALTQQKVARDALDATRDSGDTVKEQARYNLFAADKAVEAAQARLDRLEAGPTQRQVDSGNANVAIAQAQRDAAQAQLDQLRAGASAGQLQAARANVAAMTAQRNAAQAQLDLLRAGADVHQIAAAQANVDQAQIALELAQEELDKATLVAPFDGVVTAVNIQPEQLTPATLPALTLADVSELKMVVDVDEIDVARLEEGQDVMVSVDALPGEVISGYVSRIAPAADQVGGVVVYGVTVVLDETDLPLRAGMSATAEIVTDKLEDVLLVPNWAIRIDRGTGKSYVNLMRAEAVEEVEVEIGVRGADESEVLSGLNEGDVVVAGDIGGLREVLNGGE